MTPSKISPRCIDAMRDAFLSVLEELHKEDFPPTFFVPGDSEWESFAAGTATWFFRRSESKAAVAKLEDQFLRSAWSEKWSRKYIEAVRSSALSNCVANPDPVNVRHWMEEAATELDQEPPVNRAIFAVSGVAVAIPLSFGPVSVFQMTENEATWLIDSFAKIIAGMLDSAEVKEKNLKDIRAIIEQLKGSACIEVKLSGDTTKASDDAPNLAEPIIDLLQLIASLEGPGHINVLAKSLSSADPPFLLLAADGTSGHLGVDMKGTWRTLITESSIANIGNKGFANLIDAIKKREEQRTPFEETLLASLHWVAHGHRQIYPENQITSFVTAIELFFTTSDIPISRDVSEGVAIILRRTLQERKTEYSAMRDFYKLRNKASHAGDRSATQTKATHLETIALNFLAEMSLRAARFRERKDFSRWLGDLRLSVALDSEPGTTAAHSEAL
jgi:hypothetical protein